MDNGKLHVEIGMDGNVEALVNSAEFVPETKEGTHG
nr:MAG TPA: hypothetical protein [Caudoviricetes sp.]